MPPYVAVGVHPRHDFLPWIATLIQAECFSFQVRFRWDDLFVEVRPGLRKPASMRRASRAWPPTALMPYVAPASMSRSQAVLRVSTGNNISKSFSPVSSVRRTNALWPPILATMALTGVRSLISTPKAALTVGQAFGSADEQESPGLRTVLHLGFDAVEKKLSESLEGGLADLADIFYHRLSARV